MNRRRISLLIVLAGAVIVRVAVWLHPPSRQVWPSSTKAVAASTAESSVPEIAPGPPAVKARPAAAPPSRARRAFDRLLAALRSGDKAKIKESLEGVRAELVPPPVPDEENAAVLYKKAFEKHVGETDEADVEILGKLYDGREITAAERAKLQGYVDQNREALALLHQAAERPRCNFGLEYSQGIAMELPHISPLILSARLLEVESALAAKGQGSDIARASLRLSEAVADEPLLLSQVIRTVLHGISAEVSQKEFEGDIPRERLQALLGLSPDRIREGYENVLLFELYSGVKFVTEGGDRKQLGLEGLPVRRPDDPLTAHDLEYFAQTLSEYAALAGRPYYEVREDLERLRVSRIDAAPWYAELTKAMIPAMGKAQERQATTEAYLGTAQLAAALRMYQDAHGAYPATLDAVREILPQLPLDPFTGKPYLYRREGSGFVVYSTGANRVDSGGVGGQTGQEDILFRSPR